MAIIDMIFDQVNEVLGGTDDNQIFTMMLPGTLLDPADFSRGPDTEIALRCSNLVNALLDVCDVAASHNGRTLSAQYRSALDRLLPQINPDLEKMRHTLRDGLKQTIDVTLPDGTKATMTKLDWFYRQVDAYNRTVADWGDARAAQVKAIAAQFPNAADADKREDAFNAWFALKSPAAQARIKQAHVQVTTVFSPDEEALIDSLLDGGDSEITRSKQDLDAAGTAYPHGEAYPATFTPSDWPSLLASDFGYVDLLKSPEAIAMKIDAAHRVIAEATDSLNAIGADMPTDLKGDLADLTAAQQGYADAQSAILKTYTNNAATAAKIYLSKKNNDPKSQTSDLAGLTDQLEKGNSKDGKGTGKNDGSKIGDKDVDALVKGQTALIDAQAKVQASGLKMADAALKYSGDQAQYLNLKPYFDRLNQATKEVGTLENQLAAAANTAPDTLKQIFPNAASERFSQVQIEFTKDQIKDDSKLSTSFSQTDWSVDVFFGSASGSKSEAHSKFTHDVLDDKEQFSIGFLVAKVEIDRPWFEPGLFGRTADMRSIGTTRISPGPLKREAFKQAAGTVLPAFPTAFVIAKDVTINLTLTNGQTHQAREVLDKHESESGGLLCFSVSHTSAEHEDTKSFSSQVQGNSVMIRIASPQIIGWYQEFLPLDESKPITEADDGGFSEFLSAYRSVQANVVAPPKLAQAV